MDKLRQIGSSMPSGSYSTLSVAIRKKIEERRKEIEQLKHGSACFIAQFGMGGKISYADLYDFAFEALDDKRLKRIENGGILNVYSEIIHDIGERFDKEENQ